MCTRTLSCYNLDSIFDIRWICFRCFSITVVVAIFEMGTIFMTRAPPSLISALFFIVCLCAFCFSIPVVVTILCGVILLCASFFFWIDYRIIEFIGHLFFCKKRDFYDGHSEKKSGMLFFLFLFVGEQEKRNIYFKKQTKKTKKTRLIEI